MKCSGGHLVRLAGFLAAASLLAIPASASAAPVSCSKFVIGRANSTAYPHFRLPARGSVNGASCSTLRRIAKRLHRGAYDIPDDAGAIAPDWGEVFRIDDRGRTWSCRLQNRGGSGPSYAVRCRSRSAALTWRTG